MQNKLKLSKTRFYAFISFLAYVISISFGAVQYLPYQSYAPGIFKTYSVSGVEYFVIAAIAFISALMIPRRVERPSDWFLIIFIIFLLLPGITLGVTSNELAFEKKIIILPVLLISIVMVFMAGRINIAGRNHDLEVPINKSLLYIGIIGWVILIILLIAKHHSVMRFASLDSIYEQRALTSAVGAFWGYIQLYFTYVFCTLLIAYGLTINKWWWVVIGSFGYFTMYLITAEKSILAFPFYFIAVAYLTKSKKPALQIIAIVVALFALIIFGVGVYSETVNFFDKAGFYFFSRLIATPGQFVLDYYDFFSSNGFTFFSQIKGINLFVDAPAQYALDPKWPQLGWIVGAGFHGIESNSNATFIASDGAASLGALGIIILTAILCLYLVVLNTLSKKIHKTFWSIIFAQQALNLISGSLFSLMLSFGGFFFLIVLILYQPVKTNKPTL
jgi:hypothetical protein